MSDEKTLPSIPPPIKGILIFLGVSGSGLLGWMTRETGEILIPAKPLTAILSASGALILTWASWTYFLWKRDSKRERISDALRKGRLICHCTPDGEIMTQHHHEGTSSIDAYACPACGNYEVVHPPGAVLIAEETAFKPNLPASARMKWLNDSSRQK